MVLPIEYRFGTGGDLDAIDLGANLGAFVFERDG